MPIRPLVRTRTRRTLVRACALACAIALAAFALTACGTPAASTGGAPGASSASGGEVQKLSVDLSSGTYVPAELTAKAGVAVQITFGQGSGCIRELVFPAFGIRADMTKGPQTFDLGVLKAGDYPWACGMDMEHGVLKVR